MEEKPVALWTPGERVWKALVAIKDIKVRAEGVAGPRLTASIFDHTGQRKLKCWELSEDIMETLQAAAEASPPVVRVSGLVDKKQGYIGELTLDAAMEATAEDAGYAEHAFLTLPADHAALIEGLDFLIGSVREPGLRALLEKTIGKQGKWRDPYLTAVAAKSNHHAYAGGLLRHSIEVAELALHTTRRFRVNRDLVLTAGLLHDIGKLWEMEHTWRAGIYTPAGTLKGHIILALERLGPLCRTLKLPETLADSLLHAILAHHDELQYGSPVRPATAEAIALAKADQLSAELTQFFEAQSAEAELTVWRGGRSLYLGGSDLSLPEALPALSEDPEERLLRRMEQASGTPSGFGAISLPVLGVVAAGDGVRSSSEEAEPDEREILPPSGGADYLLRVSGDSMIGAGILEGDLLAVKRQETARPGQIVIAHIPAQGMVVKRLTELAAGRFLSSENPSYPAIPVTEAVTIQGVVVKQEREL